MLFNMPRGRPRTRPIEDATENTAPRPVRRRGPNRKTLTVSAAPDSFVETKAIIAAILKSRGDRGASAEILQNVISWARNVRAEEAALKELSSRQRRPKTGVDGDRVAKNELNRALLEGILEGVITLDVSEEGTLSFRHITPVVQEFAVVDAEDVIAAE